MSYSGRSTSGRTHIWSFPSTNGALGEIDKGMEDRVILNFNSVTDGLSNTLFVGEKHVPTGQLGQGPHDSSIYNGDSQAASRFAGLNFPLANSPTEPRMLFGSEHSSTVHFLMGDGSVRGLTKSINLTTLDALATRNSGEVISLD